MAETPTVTPAEVKRRMEAGEDFTFIDVRNTQACAKSDATYQSTVSDSNYKNGGNQKTAGKRFVGQTRRTMAVAGIAGSSSETLSPGICQQPQTISQR